MRNAITPEQYSECYELIKEFDSLEDAEIDWDVSSGTYNILDARLVDK